MRWIRHVPSQNKRLFPYTDLATYDDCDELIICLSERSLNIILNALTKTEEMRTRVWTTRQGDLYQIASEEEFEQFRLWTNDVYNQLGSWVMCNELLEQMLEQQTRIADSLESLDEKAQTFITWQNVLDDLATSLGLAHPFYLLLKAFSDLVPSIKNVKLDPWPMVVAMWRTRTFEAPLLAGILGMNASLGTIAAATVGEALVSKLKALIAGFGTLNDYYDNVRAALLGDFNLLDFLQSLMGWFISDEEGGEGGEDPDNDPTIRTDVNIATNVTVPITVNCSACGSSGGCSCGGTGYSDDTPLDTVNDAPTAEEPDREGDPPTGYGSWEEYDHDKCARIKEFMDRYIGTLRNLGTLVEIFGTLTIALIAGLISVELAASGRNFLYSLLARIYTDWAGAFGSLADIANHLDENLDEIICEMEDQDTTDGMIEQLHSAIGDAIASLGLSEPDLEGLLEGVCETLASTNSMNSIITSTTVPAGYEDYTCPCDAGGFLVTVSDPLFVGEDDAPFTQDGTHYTIEATFHAGRWGCAFRIIDNEVDENPLCGIFENYSRTGSAPIEGYPDYFYACGAETYTVITTSPYSAEIKEMDCVHSIGFQSDGPFTVEFDIVDICT